ncbi:MAG: TonB family protein [Pseudomonadota bacterium]|nr:TonB family protein [Pseudomonadota bacterium]
MKPLAISVVSLGVTTLLFLLMQAMLHHEGPPEMILAEPIRLADFIRTPEPSEPVPSRRAAITRTEPTPTVQTPMPQRAVGSVAEGATLMSLPMTVPAIRITPGIRVGTGPSLPATLAEPVREPGLSPGFGSLETNVVPTMHVPPQYPIRARLDRIEGYVDVAFTITKQGRVTDIEVLRAEPPNVFERSALMALRQWRFEPRYRDGRPVEIRAMQRFEFQLRDGP